MIQLAAEADSGVALAGSQTVATPLREIHSSELLLQRQKQKSGKKFMLLSDHNGSLLRQQPGAKTIGHSPYYCTQLADSLAWIVWTWRRIWARAKSMYHHAEGLRVAGLDCVL